MSKLFSTGPGIVLFYGSLCLAIYLLQLFPGTGIFLMFFMGPIWIGVLIHVLMVHLAIAAGAGNISRLWLAAPIVYYAGGFGLHLYSVRQADAEVAAIEAENTAARTTVEQPFVYMFRYSHEDEFFAHFRAERAFITEGNKEFGQYDYAQGAGCDVNARWDYKKRDEPYLRRADIFPSYRGADKMRQCIVSKMVKNAEWRYRLETKSLAKGTWLNPRYGVEWSMIDDKSGRAIATVRTASIGSLPVVQTVIAGCSLNSGAPRWECGGGLMSSSDRVTAGYRPRPPDGNPFTPTNDPDTWPDSALGRALSLEPRRPNG